MLVPGQLAYIRIVCPTCATIIPIGQQDSDFFISDCPNPACSDYGASALIEKRTGRILTVTRYSWLDADGERWRLVTEKVPPVPVPAPAPVSTPVPYSASAPESSSSKEPS